jgi:hypothetical protein
MLGVVIMTVYIVEKTKDDSLELTDTIRSKGVKRGGIPVPFTGKSTSRRLAESKGKVIFSTPFKTASAYTNSSDGFFELMTMGEKKRKIDTDSYKYPVELKPEEYFSMIKIFKNDLHDMKTDSYRSRETKFENLMEIEKKTCKIKDKHGNPKAFMGNAIKWSDLPTLIECMETCYNGLKIAYKNRNNIYIF